MLCYRIQRKDGNFRDVLMDEEIRQMIIERRSSPEIKKKAREKGMRTLRESGMILVEKGLTDLKEVIRVVEADDGI